MRNTVILLAVAIFSLAACEPEEEAASADNAFATVDRFAAAQASCREDGGRWGRGGAAQQFVCYQPTPDANASCAAQTDCATLCLARSRTCAPEAPLFGCHEVLTNRGFPATICID
ncbi:MAG: hypothetical protein AAFN59_01715 [Pseudomonadota bacterium]